MNRTMAYVKTAPDLVWRLLDDNAVVVSPGAGEVRVLNSIGTVIWQLLIDGFNSNEIEDFLVSNYDVTRKNARADMEVFMEELSRRGVIIWEMINS